MFYVTFYLNDVAFHRKVRARTMEEALQRVSDFCAGIRYTDVMPPPRIEAMSVKPTRGVEYEEGF